MFLARIIINLAEIDRVALGKKRIIKMGIGKAEYNETGLHRGLALSNGGKVSDFRDVETFVGPLLRSEQGLKGFRRGKRSECR